MTMTQNKQDKLETNWKDQWVVVTTNKDRRGVFYGLLKEWDRDKDYLILEQARMIIYWSQETKGVLGLASDGAANGSKVTSTIPMIELNGITAILLATQKAQKRFRDEIWN